MMLRPQLTRAASVLLLPLALATALHGQPAPSPAPAAPAAPQLLPAAQALATPTATPDATPAATYTATLPGATATPAGNASASTYSANLTDSTLNPTLAPVPGLPEPDLDPSLANPGPAPLPAADIKRDPEDVTPSKATIKKLNEQAIAQIQAFAKSQRNPAVPDLSLDDAIRTALTKNPDILNAVEQIRLTRGQLITIAAQALPQINAVAGFTQQQTSLTDPKSPSSGGSTLNIPLPDGSIVPLDFSGGGSPYVNPQQWNVGFQASQLIYNGGAVIAGIKAARFVEDAAYFSLRQTIDQTIADVKTAFYQVILNRALVVAQQQSLTLLQQQLQDQQSRYEAGTVPRFNVLQAQVAVANQQPAVISALNNLRISQYQLVQTLGMDYKVTRPSEVPFNVVGTLPYQPRTFNPDESIRVAIQRSPVLKAQRQAILSNSENVKVQFAGYLPSVSATASYTWQNNQAFQDLGQVTQGWTYGFQGSWAIFDGFATAGNVSQARAQLKQAVINYDAAVRQVIFNVQQAISNLQTAEQTLTSQEASVVQATEALRLAQERLDAGAGTQLDVLNAQVQLLESQTTVLQARYDYLAALAQYDLALSLDAQYEEIFDDPLKPRERTKFAKVTNPTAPQPVLPGKLRQQDPISGLAANAPIPYQPAGNPKVAKATKAAPEPTPKPRKKFLGIF